MRRKNARLQRAAGYVVGVYELAAHSAALLVQFLLRWVAWGVLIALYAMIDLFTIAFSYVLRRELFNALVAVLVVAVGLSAGSGTVVVPNKAEVFIKQDELSCMTELLSRESNFRDPPYIRASVGEVVRLRKVDGAKAGFADSICGVVWQKIQFTGMWKNRWVIPAWLWKRNEVIARDVLLGKYAVLLAEKMSCARYYKRTDNVETTPKGLEFFTKLQPVGEIGPHTFYCDPNGGAKSKKAAAKPLSAPAPEKTPAPQAGKVPAPPSLSLIRQSAEYQKYIARTNGK